MASRLKQVLPATAGMLIAAFSLAAALDSPQDRQDRSKLAQHIAENAASVCETGPVNADNVAYEQRLVGVLTRAETSSLQTLKSRNITVCLDRRLENQDGSYLDGIYYARANGGVAALKDDGIPPVKRFVDPQGDNAYWHEASMVDELAAAVDRDKQPDAGGYMAATEFGKAHLISWDRMDRDDKALAANPQLRLPPLAYRGKP